MWQRAVALAALVMLSACSMRGTGEGPERADIRQERIHSVSTEEPLPLESRPSPAPAQRDASAADPFAEERGTIGFDPRRGGGSDQAVRTKQRATAPTQGLVLQQDEVMAPMAGRVGIMSLVGNQLRHVHAGTFGGHEQDYAVQFDLNGYLMTELRKALLTKTPYQPVPLNSTATLRQSHDTWMESWDGQAFAPKFQREFDGIIKQNRLDMLLVVSYRRIDDGQFLGRKLSGSGMYTRSRLGDTKAAVFSTFQFYRLVGSPAKLVEPVEAPTDRSIGDLPNADLPKDLEDMPSRYLVPVYAPLRLIAQNKIQGLVAMPRRLGK